MICRTCDRGQKFKALVCRESDKAVKAHSENRRKQPVRLFGMGFAKKLGMTAFRPFPIVLLALWLALPPTPSSAAGDVRVAVASNFLKPLRHLAKVFEADGGVRVRISTGSTGQLYAQIVNGAPFDVFLAANAREPEKLENDGAAVAGSRFTYARGRLLLLAGKGRAQRLRGDVQSALRAGRFDRLAIANPKVAPYGQAAMAVLEGLGVGDALGGKVVRGESVAQTYQFVATGNADLGFVALSQAGGAAGKGWLVPEALHPPIRQQAVLLRRSSKNPSARAFLEFLSGEKAGALIKDFGYGRD